MKKEVDKPDNRPKIVDTYMAKKVRKKPHKSKYYYDRNPESKKKKDEYNTEYHSTKERKAYKAELARERRKRKIMGKGGKDVSHTKDGKFVLENPSANRARNRGKK